jgi:FAD dependent oxidoreductase TIGR03364
MQTFNFDVAVIGSGIVGTSLAYHAALQGKKVVVLERDAQSWGATIRNFGMVWPIGQPASLFPRAMKSRKHWMDLAEQAGFWASPVGSLHLAYHEDEAEVLNELAAGNRGYEVQWLSPGLVHQQCDSVRADGLLGGLYSSTEVNVDPRQALPAIQQWLMRELEVEYWFNAAAIACRQGEVWLTHQMIFADEIYIATGSDFEHLFPEVFAEAPFTKCKLQMMRTAPQPHQWVLGPMLCAGLTLQHYGAFKDLPALAKVKQRFAASMQPYNEKGIHVLVSQTADGAITLGDSHEYGPGFDPFISESINQMILDYLDTFFICPDRSIAERWTGVYAKLTDGKSEYVHEVEQGVTIVNGLGGAGMTLSLGLAEEIVHGVYPASSASITVQG